MSKVWFITGANSGIGAGIARAALKAGDRVVSAGIFKLRNGMNVQENNSITPAKLPKPTDS